MSEKRFNDPYSCGGGAGRWNSKGTRMIYAANNPSLAQLEYICIQGSAAIGIKPWYMITYRIEDKFDIPSLNATNLPTDWDMLLHQHSTQKFGDNWVMKKQDPFLKVPSARVNIYFYPFEHNLLINPNYVDIKDLLHTVDVRPFQFKLN